MTNQDLIRQLHEKLELLKKKQDDFSKEISDLQTAISSLSASQAGQVEETSHPEPASTTSTPKASEEISWAAEDVSGWQQKQQEPSASTLPPVTRKPQTESDLEKFIGENLISKIGIAITVLGVAIGAKYAIEHQMVSPLTRIILGYLVGLGLLGFAIKLKKRFENFSAVLLSGSMAILYFITYAAYSYYGLMPQFLAFVLMVLFTAFTVVAAIQYDKQVIAHIGLVGAYAVPFLLSDGSGRVAILFSYTAIINIGVLFVAFRKYWKVLYYVSFGLTWLMFASWYVTFYQSSVHFGLAFTFLTVFFITFYQALLGYKLIKKEKYDIDDVSLLLVNAFLFYGIGYAMLQDHPRGRHLLGLFTLCNAIVHFVVSATIHRQKLADRNLFYLVSGLVLVFLTIAIPVQLDGNWVTLLWAGEAALLFWIGRTKKIALYEKLSYPLMILSFFSLAHDWMHGYDTYSFGHPETRVLPILNISFLTSLLFIGAFGFINYLNSNKKHPSLLDSRNVFYKIIFYCIPAILLFTIYYSFRLEIANYLDQRYIASMVEVNTGSDSGSDYYHNVDLLRLKVIWIINYSLFFLSALAFVNIRKIKNQQLGLVNLVLIVLVLLMFLTQGLYLLSQLRESYLDQRLAEYYLRDGFNITIRYISLAFVALTLIASSKYIGQDFIRKDLRAHFDLVLHVTVLWIASSELIHWMDVGNSNQSYKLGLSILWGAYSLFLISIGIWKKRKLYRFGAIVLFGATLIKLFTYDIAHLNTISKTIVFVSLGILLLIISFLYHKYKHIIADEPEN